MLKFGRGSEAGAALRLLSSMMCETSANREASISLHYRIAGKIFHEVALRCDSCISTYAASEQCYLSSPQTPPQLNLNSPPLSLSAYSLYASLFLGAEHRVFAEDVQDGLCLFVRQLGEVETHHLVVRHHHQPAVSVSVLQRHVHHL